MREPTTLQNISKRLMERDAFEREMRVMRILLAELILEHRDGEMRLSERRLVDDASGVVLEIQRDFESDDSIIVRAKRRVADA